jgi:hypothetical protein
LTTDVDGVLAEGATEGSLDGPAEAAGLFASCFAADELGVTLVGAAVGLELVEVAIGGFVTETDLAAVDELVVVGFLAVAADAAAFEVPLSLTVVGPCAVAAGTFLSTARELIAVFAVAAVVVVVLRATVGSSGFEADVVRGTGRRVAVAEAVLAFADEVGALTAVREGAATVLFTGTFSSLSLLVLAVTLAGFTALACGPGSETFKTLSISFANTSSSFPSTSTFFPLVTAVLAVVRVVRVGTTSSARLAERVALRVGMLVREGYMQLLTMSKWRLNRKEVATCNASDRSRGK